MKTDKSLINIYIIVISVLIVIASPIKNLSIKYLPSKSSISTYSNGNHVHSQSMLPIVKINIESVYEQFNHDDLSAQKNMTIQAPIGYQRIKFITFVNNVILFDNHRLMVLRI